MASSFWVNLLFLLNCYFTIAVESAHIRLIGDQPNGDQTYRGKVEVWTRYCVLGVLICKDAWLAVCHDGSTDTVHQSWDSTSATVACRELGYHSGWDEALPGITTDYSVEGVVCPSAATTSLENCTWDSLEFCGCSSILFDTTARCDEHRTKDQAAVECYDLKDTSIRLRDTDSNPQTPSPITTSRGKLEVLYRNEWYDVCFRGSDDDDVVWSLEDANVVCKQLGYLGVEYTSTNDNNYIVAGNENSDSTQKSIDDFKCRGDEDNLFSCRPDQPSNSGCGDHNHVFVACKDTGRQEVTTMVTEDTPASALEKETPLVVGLVIGVVCIFAVIITAVVILVQYFRKRKTSHSEPQHTDTTMTRSNAAFQPDNLYDDISDRDIQNGPTVPPPAETAQPQTHDHEYAVVNRSHSDRRVSGGGGYAVVNRSHSDRREGGGGGGVTPPDGEYRASAASEDSGEEGWVDNVAYARHSEIHGHDDSAHHTHQRSNDQEGWVENRIYEGD